MSPTDEHPKEDCSPWHGDATTKYSGELLALGASTTARTHMSYSLVPTQTRCASDAVRRQQVSEARRPALR